MILIPKHRDIVLPFYGRVGMAGLYRMEAINVEDGRTRWLTPWFSNNITNAGLDYCATSNTRYAACQVGTGNAAPTNADTTLQTFRAGTATKVFQSRPNGVSPTYYTEWYCRYDFGSGAASGNLSEVGIGPSSASGSTLFSRELIRDSGGNPTTITIAANEALRVHYKLRHYPPLVDVTGVVNGTINGSPVTRNFTRRAWRVNQALYWGPMEGNNSAGSPDSNCPLFGTGGVGFSTSPQAAHTGSLTTITGSLPGGTRYESSSKSAGAYSPGSFVRSYTTTWSTSLANASLKTFTFSAGGGYTGEGETYAAAFQVEFDTAITKTSNDVLTVEFQISWGRYTP